MVVRLLKRGLLPISVRPKRYVWAYAAVLVVLYLPLVQAASPPLENGRAVDGLVRLARAPEGASGGAGVPLVADAAREPLVLNAARPSDPITRAKRAVADCQDRYRYVHDYTCTFIKRERIDGRLTPQHIMSMKA